jgi:hypothetical protein
MHPLTPVWDILMYIVLPLWVLAGFADYLCHRRTHIENANGAAESALHWLMLGEVGVPILAAVFLRIDALVMIFMIVCLVAHEITGWLDLQIAMRTRTVTATEQQIHSVLEMMPLTAMLLVFILHWPQAEALIGMGSAHADFSIALKPPPSLDEIIPPAIAFLIFAILPYAEEIVRGLRAQKRGTVLWAGTVPPPDA